MFRSALANVYRTPSFATVSRMAGPRSATSAFARRMYSDKPKDTEPKRLRQPPRRTRHRQQEGRQVKELKDAYLRSLADAENIRTRTKIEVDNTKVFAIQKFAKDLLDTVDILELALKHVPKGDLVDKIANKTLVDLHEGVEMTKSNLLKTLERHGVESFDPIDKPYDPNTSHALYQAPMAGKTPGDVFNVEKRGYIINGRVLRPAQVGVVLDPNGN
ncbi:mitochondrial co-chaperone-like protein GrpE [Kickxella alabastrina]|uniref:mitochondrial co-chaperone-like protein GrpE n=1 Tax=Kickxella alabastrina TaxID=61397 RepID=UPI0022202563|nr:mitochondrial co-chaperone-like protein GrpE [Kickxella alabastrina]KAI7823650.1 mitochondrial co-chaperone-like protein GrpE [Kickxella alabastrina]